MRGGKKTYNIALVLLRGAGAEGLAGVSLTHTPGTYSNMLVHFDVSARIEQEKWLGLPRSRMATEFGSTLKSVIVAAEARPRAITTETRERMLSMGWEDSDGSRKALSQVSYYLENRYCRMRYYREQQQQC